MPSSASPDSLDFRPADWWNLVKRDYVFLSDFMYLFGYTCVYTCLCAHVCECIYTQQAYLCCLPIWLFTTQINHFGNREWHGNKSTLCANARNEKAPHLYKLFYFFRRRDEGNCALCSTRRYQCTLSRCWPGQAFQGKRETRHPLCKSRVVADVRY